MSHQSSISSKWERYRAANLEKYRAAVRAGAVDPPIFPLLELINTNPRFVTTSSCSGRVVLLATTRREKKGESFFYRKWHRPVTFDEVWEGIESFGGQVLWFKVDPFILHVGARDPDSALLLLRAARSAGIKIAGIQSLDDSKAHVEIRGIDALAVPVYDGRLLVDRDYVKHLVRFANVKMVRNLGRLERLYQSVSTVL